jgi:ABC-type nitrate/sulfonate/bicarbonate transport system substrate-binding protein
LAPSPESLEAAFFMLDGDPMSSPISKTFAARVIALACAATLALAGCGPAASQAPSAAPSRTGAQPTSPPTSTPRTSAASSASTAVRGTVRFALDWTPNTNHTGIYVAQANGWYGDAGVDVEILPYGTTTPETLMTAGQADCGISFQDALTFAVAGGAPLVSVMAVLQHTAQEVAVLESSPITRPRELDGKTYAGFGYPNEEPTLKSVIQHDGGTGAFKTVTLDTAAYEALYARKADFVITFAAWEGIEAEQRGIKLRTFQFGDYGFPDFYQVVIACDSRWLAKDPDLARAFVGATVRGYEVAADDPDGAAAILVAQNPGVFDGAPGLPVASQRFLAEGGFLKEASSAVGSQTLERWTGYSEFLFDQGLLAGRDGKPLTAAPDYAALFTNDYLP